MHLRHRWIAGVLVIASGLVWAPPRLPFAPAVLQAAAYSSYVGTFAQPGSTGNQSVTGVGFQPKAIIFTMTSLTAAGTGAGVRHFVGFATSSSARGGAGTSYNDGNASGNGPARKYVRIAKCLAIGDASGTTTVEADFVSMDADGFTINWTTADATARVVTFLALGGTDITNAGVGVFSSPSSAGNLGVTGVGFRPDVVLFTSGNSSTSPDNSANNASFEFGAAASSSAQGTIATFVQSNSANSPANRYQRSTKAISALAAGGTVGLEADFTSMDADGFTLNYTSATGGSEKIVYLAIKGGNYTVGAFNQVTSSGNQSVTTGFTPKAELLFSDGAAASTSVGTHARFSIGFSVSSSARGSTFVGVTDNQTVTGVADSSLSTTRALQLVTEPSTVNADFDFVSQDGAGFTLSTTADATARQVLYIAFGGLVSTPAGIFNTPVRGGGVRARRETAVGGAAPAPRPIFQPFSIGGRHARF